MAPSSVWARKCTNWISRNKKKRIKVKAKTPRKVLIRQQDRALPSLLRSFIGTVPASHSRVILEKGRLLSFLFLEPLNVQRYEGSHICLDTHKPPHPNPLPQSWGRGQGEGERSVNTISRRLIKLLFPPDPLLRTKMYSHPSLKRG